MINLIALNGIVKNIGVSGISDTPVYVEIDSETASVTVLTQYTTLEPGDYVFVQGRLFGSLDKPHFIVADVCKREFGNDSK